MALSCGMLPLADGSDEGGSLRNPGNFCNIVGFRTSPGRVPVWPNLVAWLPIPVHGPMARTVQDVALMLSAIAGPDPRSPISISEPASLFARPLDRDFKGARIAWSKDLGELPVDPKVTQVLENERHVFEDLGCIVEEGLPVGMQIVGRHNDDLGVLQLAYAFEKATGLWQKHPLVAQ